MENAHKFHPLPIKKNKKEEKKKKKMPFHLFCSIDESMPSLKNVRIVSEACFVSAIILKLRITQLYNGWFRRFKFNFFQNIRFLKKYNIMTS